MSKRRQFDPYNDDLELDQYKLDVDDAFEEEEDNYVPTINNINGSYGYDDEQWD